MRAWVLMAGVAMFSVTGCDSGSEPTFSTTDFAARYAPTPTAPTATGQVAFGPPRPDSGDYTFDVRDGAKSVTVRASDLGGRLFRASTPAGPAMPPNTQLREHTLTVGLGGGGDGRFTFELDKDVARLLRFRGGAGAVAVDMSAGRLAGLEVTKGVSSFAMTAGRPTAPVTVREYAGFGSLAIHLPTGTPITVRLRAGAGTVTLYGRDHRGLAAGTTLTGGSGTGPGYLVDARAGIGTVTVDAAG